jgi:NAD(P)-dependent dehydrogenase (short-subunit alcohol dehydrogenase family)
MNVTSLAGRTALVTGGGRGLGREICLALGAAGMRVAVCDLVANTAEAVADELRSRDVAAAGIAMDVGDETSAARGWEEAERRLGPIAALVNNAGVDVTVPIEELAVDDFDRVMRTNLRGPFLLSRIALPRMRERGGGSIVNIVSTAAKRAWANALAYHSSKWGLLGFSHALHVEGRAANVKVTAVIAGGMRTPFLTERFPDLDLSTLQDPANVARAVRFALEQPDGTVIPELLVLPARETSWP